MSGQQTFADWLREKTRGKSQRDIAHKARVSPTTIGNYYLGRLPSLDDGDLLRRLADALAVSVDDLRTVIFAEKESRSKEDAIARLSDENLKSMIRAYRSARHEGARRRAIDAFFEVLKEDDALEANEEEVPFDR